MSKKKWHITLFRILSILCWIATIIPSGYVLYYAFRSMSGTMHGFNGEMLYGIDAFIDTILMVIAFWFPLYLLWVLCFLGAVIFTIVTLYLKKRSG